MTYRKRDCISNTFRCLSHLTTMFPSPSSISQNLSSVPLSLVSSPSNLTAVFCKAEFARTTAVTLLQLSNFSKQTLISCTTLSKAVSESVACCGPRKPCAAVCRFWAALMAAVVAAEAGSMERLSITLLMCEMNLMMSSRDFGESSHL